MEKSIGPTGEFPQGKIDAQDEGELKLGIGIKEGNVIIAFGKSITWLGLDIPTAQTLVDLIQKKIELIKQGIVNEDK